jgi:hypothetical protein
VSRESHLPKTLAVLAAAVLAACSRGPDTGTITGEAYVVDESGGQVNVDPRSVHLLRSAASVDSGLAVICVHRQRSQAASPDSTLSKAASDSTWAERAAFLSRRALPVHLAPRGSARFTIDSLPPGPYRVWADATVGGERWTWLDSIYVKRGETTKVSLSNSNPDEDPFRCQRPDLLQTARKQ